MVITKTIHAKTLQLTEQKKYLDHNYTFSDLVLDAHKKYTALEREFNIGDLFYTLRSTNYETVDGGVFMHLVRYEKGAVTATVPKAKGDEDSIPVEEKKAPKGADYLNDDCFLYIYRNYLFYIYNGLGSTTAQNYLNELLSKAGFIENNQKLILTDMIDHNMLAKIKKHRVKAIKIKPLFDSGTWYATEHLASTSKGLRQLTGSIFNVFKEYQNKDANPTKLNYQIGISKNLKLEAIEKDELTLATLDFYEHSTEDEFQFYIELEDGSEIIPGNKIKLKKENVPVTTKGNSLDEEHATNAMKAYKNELLSKQIIHDD